MRKLAKELGVDLATVAGTGPGGRVTAADVRATDDGCRRSAGPARATAGRPPGDGPQPGRRLAQVPHISLFDELDARPVLAAHAALRARDDGVTLTALFARAAVVALEAFPILNASLDAERDEIVLHGAVHLGVAVASDDGLVVPVVHDAHERDVVDLGHEIVRVTEAGRAGHLAARAAPRRDLHRHQLRHRGWPLRHTDRPSAPGRDPRLRRGAGAPGGRR